jgi:hypothetical protein
MRSIDISIDENVAMQAAKIDKVCFVIEHLASVQRKDGLSKQPFLRIWSQWVKN